MSRGANLASTSQPSRWPAMPSSEAATTSSYDMLESPPPSRSDRPPSTKEAANSLDRLSSAAAMADQGSARHTVTASISSSSSLACNGATTAKGNAPPASYMRLSRISCDPCRKRKLRCDRVAPCSTCVRRGIASQCYQEGESSRDGDNSSGTGTGQEARMTSQTRRSSPRDMHSPIQRGPDSQREETWRNEYESDVKRVRRSNSTANSATQSSHVPHQGDEESAQDALFMARRQLAALATLARDSSSSIEMLLDNVKGHARPDPDASKLVRAPVTGPDGLIRWVDLAPFLPPREDCAELIRIYFDDLGYYFRVTQRSWIESSWHKLCEGPGLRPNVVLNICAILAIADGTLPSKARLRRHSMDEHHRWICLTGNPLVTSFSSTVDNSFERISALFIMSMYYMFRGRHDRLWETVGAAVRKGQSLKLFCERSHSWKGLTNLEKEYRRRLAWYMVSLERWQAYMRQLPSALHPDHVFLSLPSFAPDEAVERGDIPPPTIMPTFPKTLPDGRLQTNMSASDGQVVKFVFVELVAVCHEFLNQYHHMTPSQRYSRAQQIDDLLERTLIDGLVETGMDLRDLRRLRYLTSQSLDTCPEPRQQGVVMWVSHLFFLRCSITRLFLTDEKAPGHLRFVSLNYAQGIVSAIPMLMRLIKAGIKPLQVTWSANHLLCAAMAFAVVILGHDPYAGIDSDPVRALTGTSRRGNFPQEQVQWLADHIFSTLECIHFLVADGNGAALVAKRLLEALVGSQAELRNLYRQRVIHTDQQPYYPFRAGSDRLPSFEEESRRDHHSMEPAYRYSSARSAALHASLSDIGSFGGGGAVSTSAHGRRSDGSPDAYHYGPPSHHAHHSHGNDAHYLHTAPALPRIQPYPPSLHAGNATSIVGRFTNASSLLDAMLMEPLEPEADDGETSNTAELLASLMRGEPTFSHTLTGATTA